MSVSLTKKFLFLLVPLAAVGAIVLTLTWRYLGSTNAKVERTRGVADLAIQSRVFVSEMGGALKGYLLDPRNGAEIDHKKKADDENSAALKSMMVLADREEVRSLVEAMSEFDEKKLNASEDKVMGLCQEGRVDEARQVFSKEYLPLRAQYDEMSKSLVQQTKAAADQELRSFQDHMKQAAWTISAALVFGLSLVGGLIALIAVRLKSILSRLISSLTAGAESVGTCAESVGHLSGEMSSGMTTQAAAVQQTASAIEQINATVAMTSQNAEESRDVARESSRKAQEGRSAMEAMRVSIDEIAESSRKVAEQVDEGNREIGQIVNLIAEITSKTKVINDIVFQTKLLSFNAAVEAARAGEQGKGFAVVAEEVGNLAQMSGRSSDEIAQLLESSSSQVQAIVERTRGRVQAIVGEGLAKIEHGRQSVESCGTVLQGLAIDVDRMNSMMAQISQAASEQSRSVGEISTAIRQIDGMTQKTAESSHRFVRTSTDLRDQSSTLHEAVRSLRQTIEGRRVG